MKEEGIKYNKLEYIQMYYLLIKKELNTKLIEEIKLNNQFQKEKYKNYIYTFIEDLLSIINQQLLSCAQIYESTEKTKIENIIINSKNNSLNMIINFVNKFFSLLKEKLKNSHISRNNLLNKMSCIKNIINDFDDKNDSGTSTNNKSNINNTKFRRMNYSNNIEDSYLNKKNLSNLNSGYNSIKSSKKNSQNNSKKDSKKNSKNNSKKNSNKNLNNLMLNNHNISNTNKHNSNKNFYENNNNNINLKSKYYINLNKLNESDGKDIEITIKQNKNECLSKSMERKDRIKFEKNNSKQLNDNNNSNNQIIIINKIYKGSNSSSAKKYKDYLNNERLKKNSFNKKIKNNKLSVENSKMQLKNNKIQQIDKDINLENKLNKNNVKNYKPFKPRNHKYINISKIDINTDINGNALENNHIIQDYKNLTQRFENKNSDNININTNSEKLLYNFNDEKFVKYNEFKYLSNSYNKQNYTTAINDEIEEDTKNFNYTDIKTNSNEPFQNVINDNL